jgi:hypothetical protein
MVLLDWPQPHHLWIGRNPGDSSAIDQRPQASLLASWLGPNCVSPAAQLSHE